MAGIPKKIMIIFLLFGAVFLPSVSGTETKVPCQQKDSVCGDFTDVFHQLLEPKLEEFLLANCSSLLEKVKCHVAEKEKCPHTKEKIDFKIMKGYFNVFSVLCDEKSTLRKALFRNLECYARNADMQAFCQDETFQPVLNYMHSEENTTGFREGIFLEPQYFCLYVTLGRHCIVRRADQHCGMEAAAAANQVLYLLGEQSCPAEMIAIWLDKFVAYLWNNFNKD